MDNSIIVNVSELRSRIQDVRRSGMDIVEISISPQYEEDGDLIPASLELSASRRGDTSTWVDFEDVEAIEDEENFKKSSDLAVHMGDDLM